MEWGWSVSLGWLLCWTVFGLKTNDLAASQRPTLLDCWLVHRTSSPKIPRSNLALSNEYNRAQGGGLKLLLKMTCEDFRTQCLGLERLLRSSVGVFTPGEHYTQLWGNWMRNSFEKIVRSEFAKLLMFQHKNLNNIYVLCVLCHIFIH